MRVDGRVNITRDFGRNRERTEATLVEVLNMGEVHMICGRVHSRPSGRPSLQSAFATRGSDPIPDKAAALLTRWLCSTAGAAE
jgi:hypothetical protein